MVYNFYSNSLIFIAAVLKTSYFFPNIMHKVKTQRFGELFVKDVLIIYFYMVIIKQYKVKKIL